MKKTLKSILSLVMALLLVFSVAACSDKEDKDDKDEEQAEVSEETTRPVEEEDVELDASDILGYTVGNTYYNDYAGFSIEVASDWEFYSEEEIAQLSGIAVEMLDEDLQEAIEATGVLYAMYAMDPNTGSNVNVTIEKSVSKLNAKTRAELQAEQLPAVYEDMGATDVVVEATETEIDGETFYTCDSECNIFGLTMYQKVIMIDTDEYLVAIAITSLEDGGIEEIVKGISLE